MTETTDKRMIEFKRITPADKELYESYMPDGEERGCEFTFANLYLWGRQNIAVKDGCVLLFSQFDRRSVYPYPVGQGDKQAAIDAVIEDAAARGIPCRITGLSDRARARLEELYPDRFRYHTDEGSYDYVYSIDDLADLKGRRYHGKRNHLARFYESAPSLCVIPLREDNLELAKGMTDLWYEEKLRENPDGDYHMERAALDRAYRHFSELSLEGIMLTVEEEVIAVTLASRTDSETFDVHFEKAKAGVNGAYAAVNCEMAKYIRELHPEVKYLNREEDMGIEGLRRAKRSYHPHRQVRKSWACLLEDGCDY